MPAIETATALYLIGAEPALTSITSRFQQRRERVQVSEPLDGPTTYRIHVELEAPPTAAELPVFLPSPLTLADRTMHSLQRFEKLGPDWDGNGAEKPSSTSIQQAREFIRSLAPESTIPRATLHADGHVILFLRDADRYAELEFLENSQIGYYARRGVQEWSDEIVFLGDALPPGLSDVGFIILKQGLSVAA